MGEAERGFDALRAAVNRVDLPPAASLRERADRRSRIQLVAAALVVLALLGTAAVGTRTLLGAPDQPAQTPPPASPTATIEPTPSAEPSPSTQPSAEPEATFVQGPPGCGEILAIPYFGPPGGGQPLPRSLLLRPTDWGGCYVLVDDEAGYPVYVNPPASVWPQPDVCLDQAGYVADAHRTAGRFRGYQAGPETGGFESVTRYEPGWAGAFLDEIRAKVDRCATFTRPEDHGAGVPWHSVVVATGVAGEESMVTYTGVAAHPTEVDPAQAYPGWYVAVVRVGDLVAIVEPHMDLGGNLDYTIEMAVKAARRLAG